MHGTISWGGGGSKGPIEAHGVMVLRCLRSPVFGGSICWLRFSQNLCRNVVVFDEAEVSSSTSASSQSTTSML